MILEILADRRNYQQEIEEVRNGWIEEILNFLGIETELLNQEGVSNLDKVNYLRSCDIQLIDFPGIDALQIFHQGELVGEWATPRFILYQDVDETYYKISIESWSVMEEEIEV